MFISVEGSEGSGKSTNVAMLRDFLLEQNIPVLELREPGGTAVGEEIRHLLKRVDLSPALCNESELLLFLASRAQVVREKILPALKNGVTVLCDRYFDSTIAYQGGAREISLETIRCINRFAIGNCVPDLTFLLDLPPARGFSRIYTQRGTTPDRVEMEKLAFFERVRSTYQDIAREEPRRFHTISADAPLDQVQNEMRRVVLERIGKCVHSHWR
jgi:dTMP kinase